MEKLHLGYSTKNIPIHTERNYTLHILEKTELFIKKIWWKAIFYKEQEKQQQQAGQQQKQK